MYVGTGSAGAYELLGYTDAGVDIQINTNKGEIFTDLYGPMTPQDFQDFGLTARIVVPLIAMDRTVLAKIQDKGDRTTNGQLNTPGLVLGAAGFSVGVGGYYFKVGIAAPADTPWQFLSCIMRPAFGTKLATKANPFRCEFLAWPYASYTSTTGKDVVLWNRTSFP